MITLNEKLNIHSYIVKLQIWDDSQTYSHFRLDCARRQGWLGGRSQSTYRELSFNFNSTRFSSNGTLVCASLFVYE